MKEVWICVYSHESGVRAGDEMVIEARPSWVGLSGPRYGIHSDRET